MQSNPQDKETQPSVHPTPGPGNDNGIIDISSISYDLRTNLPSEEQKLHVPDWDHHYVYAYNELNAASKAQKDFYRTFKVEFLQGNCLNLNGNVNYAFILLFDLLNDYDRHKNLSQLEKWLNILTQHYPKTHRYAQSFFNKLKYPDAAPGLPGNNQQQAHDEHYWKLGLRFRTKLNLTDAEVNLLNKLWLQTNNFCAIESCYLQLIKLFLLSVRKLEKDYKKANTSLEAIIDKISGIVSSRHLNYKNDSESHKYFVQSFSSQLYAHLFRTCENVIREVYGHKRKLTIDFPLTGLNEAEALYKVEVFSKYTDLLTELIPTIQLPDHDTDIALNILNPTRWKIRFDQICKDHGSNPQEFLYSVVALAKQNEKNSSVEDILFEASKFMAKQDKETALRLYLHHINYDLKSATFDYKKHSKSIQKNLFANDEQLNKFETLVSQFIKDHNLAAALDAVPAVYALKRKKIELDINSIQEASSRHADTVLLLNDILADEDDVPQPLTVPAATGTTGPKADLQTEDKPSEAVRPSLYVSGLGLTGIQEQSLIYFVKNNFSVAQSDFESFAKSNGSFKNHLIESINGACFDFLDDLIIEEDNDFYTVNPTYYHQLLA
ncbi:tellurite resistance TerB C-terminal domain-containing protein [Taibaiella chishuiensis]|uniref:TerB-like protein n=1 Tax=Taibaiella chishuiensis TaxID=1434707 RepID=A0A2P8CV93_9BACT|nr:tellurite resistance TerB C-terminal domain-containing protein [Taibaiella chishuiensis]PSK88859.1 TerB-like protein [Taibaiella chishuiensis]